MINISLFKIFTAKTAKGKFPQSPGSLGTHFLMAASQAPYLELCRDGARPTSGFGAYVAFGDGTYTGAFIDSKPHGKGALTLYGGDQYDGAWRNAWMSGQGTFTCASSGDMYSGMFHQNLMQGKGTFIDIYRQGGILPAFSSGVGQQRVC